MQFDRLAVNHDFIVDDVTDGYIIGASSYEIYHVCMMSVYCCGNIKLSLPWLYQTQFLSASCVNFIAVCPPCFNTMVSIFIPSI